jgi:hypothetical protein
VHSSSAGDKPPIAWYARKKPSNSNLSFRLVHVNRDITKDLLDQGKIDIFARYSNTGRLNEATGLPVIRSDCRGSKSAAGFVSQGRRRHNCHTALSISHSFPFLYRNLWNFSPKHLLTDSSGNYWRERRLPPGMYTDGKTVCEASYRYRDGRNGMSRISSLQQLLSSKNVDPKVKPRVQERLKFGAPDVVLED